MERADFEDGRLPAGSFSIGSASDVTVGVVSVEDAARAAPGIEAGPGAARLGRHLLRLRALPPGEKAGGLMTGFAFASAQDRSALEPGQRLNVSADIYLSPEPALPNIALLALDGSDAAGPAPESMPVVNRNFYRFGLAFNKTAYFSLYNLSDGKSAVYLQDREYRDQLKQPGWRNFQWTADAEGMECSVDGRALSFSPFIEKTMIKVLPGVMLAESKLSYDCYVDNLTVSVVRANPAAGAKPSSEVSPARASAPVAAAESVQRADAAGTVWLEPAAAWARAQQERKPLLLFFCSPGHESSDRVETMFETDPDARRLLETSVCARAIITIGDGAELARKYDVFKVPTIFVIQPDGKSYQRVTPSPEATWPEVAAALKR